MWSERQAMHTPKEVAPNYRPRDNAAMGKLLVLLSVFTLACGSSNSNGGAIDAGPGVDPTGDGGPIVVRDGGIPVGGDGGAWDCYETTCDGKLLECGDCLDNDGDGEFDSRDQECLGPCDNTEGPGLNAGVGGEGGGPCKADCYFDFGNGSGNDDCHWDHRCDPLSVPPNYYPEGQDCELDESMLGGTDCPATQSTTCLDVCRPLTPNGCDCFGCCTFPELDGGYVYIGALDEDKEGSCTFDLINDASACPPCTPVADCSNGCGRCELCIGKDTLPADCMAEERCDVGIQACGLDTDPNCPADDYCVSGCCQRTIIID
jgi:hypothetical protein